MSRVLVAGVPRSGTTWVARVLGHAGDTTFLNEPDNHLVFPFALRAKRCLSGGFHPALMPHDDAPEYELLWREAFGLAAAARRIDYLQLKRLRRVVSIGLLASASKKQKWAAVAQDGPLALRLRAADLLALPERPQGNTANLVVKSTYAALSLEWISYRFPVEIVVLFRDPLSIVSSWKEMGWLGRPGDDALDTLDVGVKQRLEEKWGVAVPSTNGSVVARGAWMICVLTCELLDAARRNRHWHVVTHENLYERPHQGFRELAEACSLPWTPAVDRIVDDMNRPGSGYETFRLVGELRETWRSRLSPEQARDALTVLERFPLDAARSSHDTD
jgi:hypothetical protein